MNYTLKGTPKSGLTSATLAFFIGFAAVTLTTPLVKYLNLDPVQTGNLLGIAALTGSLFRIPFAAWVESTGGKKPMLVLLGLAIIGMIIFTTLLYTKSAEYLRENLWILLSAGALAGCGIATFSVGIGQTSYWFAQEQQGKALGNYAGIGNLAPGIALLLVSNIFLPYLGLKTTYIAWTIFLIVGTIVYAIYAQNAWFFQLKQQGASEEEAISIAKEKGQSLFPKGTVIASLKTSAKVWQTWVLVFVYFLSFGGFLALGGWFRVFFQDYYGISAQVSGTLGAIYLIGASVIRVYGGGFSDRIGGRKAVTVFLVVTAIGSLILALFSSIGMSVVGLILMTLGMGIVNAGVFKLVPAYVPHAIGGAAGWVGGLGALGGYVLPKILSLFRTAGIEKDPGFLQGFYVFFVLSILSLLLVALLKPAKASK